MTTPKLLGKTPYDRISQAANAGGLMGMLARHRTASNLLMALLILAGCWSVTRLNTQFFPDATRDIIIVSAQWQGATADDVDRGIVDILEPQLRFIEGVERITSTSQIGSASIRLFFPPDRDIQKALADVESVLSQVSSYPEGAEDPKARQSIRYDTISKVVLSGPFTEAALQEWALSYRDDLLVAGIDRVTLNGLRQQEIIAEIDQTTLRKLSLSLDQVAAQVRAASNDIPAGEIGGGRSLVRSLGRISDARDLGDIEIVSQTSGASLKLSDIARVETRFDPDQAQWFRNDNPAIELHVQRALTADSLESAGIVDRQLALWQSEAPESLNIERYNYQAKALQQRIGLLIKNGLGGMILVLAALFLFMNTRSAIWVAIGIPTALLITMGFMLALGLTINMISVFAMLLVLGIVVDDAIVVSEHSETLFKQGLSPQDAAVGGAQRMFYPVMSSSLTTIAAFMPLLLIGGFTGRFVSDIPVVVTAVIIGSLIECFFILPGHMRHSFEGLSKGEAKPTALRAGIDRGFDFFRYQMFRPLVRFAVKGRYAVMAISGVALMWAVLMVQSGTVSFVFFSLPPGDSVSQSVRMVAGATREQTENMVTEMERAFWAAMEKQIAEKGIPEGVAEDRKGLHPTVNMMLKQVNGTTSGRVFAEMVSADERNIDQREFVRAWSQEIKRIGAVESLSGRRGRFGSSASDIDLKIIGDDADQLKAVSLAVQGRMANVEGLEGITDSLAFGTPEKIIRLSDTGKSLGLTLDYVGRQLRTAIEGVEVERLQDGDQETVVSLSFPDAMVQALALDDTPIVTQQSQFLRLGDIAQIQDKVGLAQILREDGQRVINVTADLADEDAEANEIIERLLAAGVGEVVDRAGLTWEFVGDAAEQREAFSDLNVSIFIAIIAIYVILAWVFSSYTLPFAVIVTIPFGFVGMVFGLWAMDFPISFLAIISFVGLSGIVVNDSIILISTVQELRQRMSAYDAIVEGAVARLRAVMLTSLTTIGGLTPLLFETSRQAQFLIPMAIVVVFGLGIATFFILLFVPALLGFIEDWRRLNRRFMGWRLVSWSSLTLFLGGVVALAGIVFGVINPGDLFRAFWLRPVAGILAIVLVAGILITIFQTLMSLSDPTEPS